MYDEKINDFVKDEIFDKIVHYLSQVKGINISSFKPNYLKRRIYFRALSLKLKDINAYWHYLVTNDEEINKLKDILTINVTSFFRNPEVFERLREDVIPAILKEKQKSKEKFLKILSIGCASGEEPYSVALILKEYFQEEIKSVKPYIVGIDFDKKSIIQAQNAIYDVQKIMTVPEVLKKKYFVIIDYRHFKLSDDIRNMVIFRHDDIFMRDLKMFWDIIFCRNVLIYLNPSHQEVLLNKIISACKQGSYLILGKSEGLFGRLRTSFFSKYPKERIYVKRSLYESKP